MKIECLENGQYVLTFDAEEKAFIEHEARESDLSPIRMFEMVLGMLFIGGYSNIIGKD